VERIPECTGVLVAGGQSRRMGGLPKGLVRMDGETIASRSLDLFRDLFGEVLVVANDPVPWAGLSVRVVPDAMAGKGAPGGLHAALAAARTGWIFAAACDMPFLSAEPIRFLAARRGEAPAALVAWERGLEGLHAFWSRDALPTVERMLREGDPSIRAIAAAVGARVVAAAEWRQVDPGGHSFENVNSPEDLARLGLEHGGSPGREP
jgi:molybdopterin-guanine dinucleotide biosynthesis protein A